MQSLLNSLKKIDLDALIFILPSTIYCAGLTLTLLSGVNALTVFLVAILFPSLNVFLAKFSRLNLRSRSLFCTMQNYTFFISLLLYFIPLCALGFTLFKVIEFLVYFSNQTKVLLKEPTCSISSNKQRAWDVSLIIAFAQELTEVFPEEWNEWQHWISDMIEDRTRMQSKGMNHRLVSLITFYRLTRFIWHIGIDKVFILATRRATR